MKLSANEKKATYKVKETQNKNDSLQLDSILSFRLKNSELIKLKERAKNENRSISNYIKTQLNINDK